MDKRSSPSDPLRWLNLMVSEPYYMFHFLVFFSYLVIRNSAARILAPHIIDRLFHREIQAILSFSLVAFVKYVREETWEAFIADTLFIGKICLFALAFTLDRRLAVWYIIVFVVIYLLTQQPPYERLGACNKLTPLQLESLLTEGNTSKFWLVAFCASYTPACIRGSRCLPELSITYSNRNLSFGIVDLGLFPNAAEKFGISLSGRMSQLPTFILFENASEIARFPELDSEASFFGEKIEKRILCQHFDLDRHLLEYVNGK